jgi:hypothetical protein
MADVKLTVDVEDAKKFLNEVADAARAQFAICRSGDVVMVECDQSITAEVHEHLRNAFAGALEGTGVRVVILPKGFRVARINLEHPEAS